METFKINFGNHSNVVFPTVIRPFVTKSILVETFEVSLKVLTSGIIHCMPC